MRSRKIRIAATAGLLALTYGCGDIVKKLTPDRYRTGVVWRRVSGSFRNIKNFKVRENIPLYRVQGNRRINEHFDVYARLDFNIGRVKATPFDAWVRGDMESFGAGLSYFPLSRSSDLDFSLDLGAELFHVGVDMRGNFGLIKSNVHDTIFGWGVNAGTTLGYEVNDNLSLFASGGYNFTDNDANKAGANFDGPYWFVGFKLSLP